MVPVTNKRGQVAQKPEVIAKYNEFMSGVDRQDQLLAYYPCERKTLRWYLNVAIHTFQMLLINSFKLYNRYSGQPKMSLHDYRLSVISALLPDKHVTANPGPMRRPPMTHKICKITERNAKVVAHKPAQGTTGVNHFILPSKLPQFSYISILSFPVYKRKPQQVSPLHYNLLLQCPTHRTDFLHSSFFIQSILLWNALPTDREERGSSDYRMSDDVFVCRWNDNDVVTVAINFENWALTTVTRWSNEKKRKNFNPQPSVIASYNMHMGGVDKCDQLVPNLRTRMRIRKWWWPIFAYFLDVSVVNGWVLSRKNGCNKETARSLLASHGTSPHQGQKPAKPLSTTRYDGKDHWIVPISTERRCANQC
uniref:SFRICE_028619 n=1 Tax=Spodoptera frugiperda TaxID=7108 RepID=A0A2H1WZ04_SPOFR